MLEKNFSSREVSVYLRIGERRVHQIARELELAGLIEVVLPEKAAKKPVEKRAFNSVWDGLLTESDTDPLDDQS
jgi:hypothetical protein